MGHRIVDTRTHGVSSDHDRYPLSPPAGLPGMLLVGAGAALVFLSGFLPWLRFQRSELSGFRLAELVASVADEYRVGPPSWLGVAWYALPLAALVSWFALVLARPVRVDPRVQVPLGAIMTGLAATFLVAAQRTVGVQAGEVVALGGGLLVVVGGVLPHKSGRTT